MELIKFGFDLISGKHSEVKIAGTEFSNPSDFKLLFDVSVALYCIQIHICGILKVGSVKAINTANELCLPLKRK